MTTKRQGGTLNGWYFRGGRVTGQVSGDTDWEEGIWINTSTPINYDSSSKVLETRNTFYTLGTQHDLIPSDPLPQKQPTDTNS